MKKITIQGFVDKVISDFTRGRYEIKVNVSDIVYEIFVKYS